METSATHFVSEELEIVLLEQVVRTVCVCAGEKQREAGGGGGGGIPKLSSVFPNPHPRMMLCSPGQIQGGRENDSHSAFPEQLKDSGLCISDLQARLQLEGQGSDMNLLLLSNFDFHDAFL